MLQEVKIDNLEPISPPGDIAFWPPQPGWYVVLVILLLLFGYGIFRYTQFRKRNAYRKKALFELERLGTAPFTGDSVSELNHLLKATALQRYPRKQVAGLTGKSWLNFLDNTVSGTHFSESPNTILENVSFTSKQATELTANQWENLVSMSAIWIKKHKVGK